MTLLKSTTLMGSGYAVGRTVNDCATGNRSSACMPIITTVTSATSTAADGNVKAANVEYSMSYIESMSQEELKEFEQLIMEKEASFNIEEKEENTETVKVYAKVK